MNIKCIYWFTPFLLDLCKSNWMLKNENNTITFISTKPIYCLEKIVLMRNELWHRNFSIWTKIEGVITISFGKLWSWTPCMVMKLKKVRLFFKFQPRGGTKRKFVISSRDELNLSSKLARPGELNSSLKLLRRAETTFTSS